MALPVQAMRYAAGGYVDGPAGPNGVRDVSPAACDVDLGCFTNTGARCSDNPGEPCDLQVTPQGRCSHGSGSCIWPQGAGVCEGAGADPVACLSDAYVDFLAGRGPYPGAQVSGPSVMCADVQGGTGQCDMSSSDPGCDCTGTDPTADPGDVDDLVPSWEGTVCGPGDATATCSDGDPFRLEVAAGLGTCFDSELGGSEVNCQNHTAEGVLGVRFPSTENPPDQFSPQRRPGSGFTSAATGGPRRALIHTAPWDIDGVGSGDFQSEGLRRLRRFANGFLWDDVFHANGVTYAADLTGPTPLACEPPLGWSSELPISGSCALDGSIFCILDSDCAGIGGICDPASFAYCHDSDSDPHTLADSGFDATGFLYTEALAPGEQTGQCPPDCRSAYDLDTFEFEALQAATESGDPRIGVQAFLDHLEGVRVGEGDVIVPLRQVATLSFGSDARCYIGGDPGRADPTDARIGRCRSSDTACDPTLPVGSNFCQSSESCLFCGGTSSIEPDATNTGYQQFGGNYGFDPARGNAEALPVGFDTHGLASLDPRARIGRLNGVVVDTRLPLVYWLVPGPVRATFKDNSCGFGDSCVLGEVTTGGPGIGPADSYFDAGDPVPHEPAGPTYLASVTVPASDSGDPLSELIRTEDVGVGPDGIPGCIGNNGSSPPPDCVGILDRFGDPGSTGADDVKILHDYSPLGDGTDLRTGSRGEGTESPLAHTPPWTGSAATSVRDIDFLGGPDLDLLQKAELSFCPVLSRDAETLGFEFACIGSDLDGDGWLDEQDGCPLNPALAMGADSGGAATPSDPGGFLPDGIIDDCQCGDANDDGRVNGNDTNFIILACLKFAPFAGTIVGEEGCRQSQVGPPAFRFDKCDVGGPFANGHCSGIDGALITRSGLGLPPGLDLTCPAYLP